MYKDYLPADYNREDVITYQWNQSREQNYQGQFNFYYSIVKNSVSKGSMLLYMILLFLLGILSDVISDAVRALLGFFI